MALHLYKNVSGMEMDVPSESGSTIRVPINKYVGGAYYSFLDNDPKWEHTTYTNAPPEPAFLNIKNSADMISYVREVFGYSRLEPVGPSVNNTPGDRGTLYEMEGPLPDTKTFGACVATVTETVYPAYTGFALGTGDANEVTFAGPTDFNALEPYAIYLDGTPVTIGTQAVPEDVYWDGGAGDFIFTVAPGLGVDITLDYSDALAPQSWISAQYPTTVPGAGV